MTISALRAAYLSGRTTPREVIDQARERIASDAYYCAWIHVLDEHELARYLEPLAMLWCIPGFRENRWNHAFRLLEKK